MRNFLKNTKILIFVKFFTKTVLKTFLRGGDTVKKNYGIVFEKFSKSMFLSKKSLEKKIVRNILKKIKFLFFFEFLTKNVLKTLLGGNETVRKNY